MLFLYSIDLHQPLRDILHNLFTDISFYLWLCCCFGIFMVVLSLFGAILCLGCSASRCGSHCRLCVSLQLFSIYIVPHCTCFSSNCGLLCLWCFFYEFVLVSCAFLLYLLLVSLSVFVALSFGIQPEICSHIQRLWPSKQSGCRFIGPTHKRIWIFHTSDRSTKLEVGCTGCI